MGATSETSDRSRSAAARRVGYVVAVLIDAAMLYAINVRPGWEVVPFLTEDTPAVLGWVNASIVVGLVANLVYLVRDPRWLKALGDIATTAVGLVALLRIWQVFPFDFGTDAFDWPLVVRILLGLGIVGSGIAILVTLFTAARRP
ncbi:hypothetical protein M1M07_17375 [Rhodococcus sp. HM1]|nr:hypothetical protein [Rhodococcus sp. HM1]